jgi:hypothetical protein
MTRIVPQHANSKAAELMLDVVDLMKTRPDLIEMESWSDSYSTKNDAAFCGTSACIAGHVNMYCGMSGKQQIQFQEFCGGPAYDDRNGSFANYVKHHRFAMSEQILQRIRENNRDPEQIMDCGALAAAILGFSPEFDTHTLFMTESWPEPFNTRYRTAYREINARSNYRSYSKFSKADRTILGQIAIDRFEHFIETGK